MLDLGVLLEQWEPSLHLVLAIVAEAVEPWLINRFEGLGRLTRKCRLSAGTPHSSRGGGVHHDKSHRLGLRCLASASYRRPLST